MTKKKRRENWAKEFIQSRMRKAGYEIRRYTFVDESHQTEVPLPAGAADYLRHDNPKLVELRRRYADSKLPASVAGMWNEQHVQKNIDLSYFRGNNAYVWGYQSETPDVVRMRFFLYTKFIESIDRLGLLGKLEEDGAFGCWTYRYGQRPAISRDLLDSINELHFLDRHFKLFSRKDTRVLDIGAGYGRMAHRMLTAVPSVSRYYCTDAIPESSFLCDYYLRHRGLQGRAQVVPLDQVQSALQPGMIDLAINIHSFSECTRDAIRWWLQQIVRLQIPYLLLLPNDEDRFNSTEVNGKHLPFLPIMEEMGFRMEVQERVYGDSEYAEFISKNDMIYLFRTPAAT